MPVNKSYLLVLVALTWVLPSFCKDQPLAALTGVVTSEAEGHMGGVLVTARPQGANMTVTVISDDQGRYAFPPGKLQPGKYILTIRAVGYELRLVGVEVGAVDLLLHREDLLAGRKDDVLLERLADGLVVDDLGDRQLAGHVAVPTGWKRGRD